jgi:ABC-2 type transport system permease protein
MLKLLFRGLISLFRSRRDPGLLPITALAHGLREVLQHGNSLPLADVGILATWAVIAVAAAAAFFCWE